MTKYLAGDRITGTSTERTGTSLPSGTNAGWKFLGRSTRVSSDKLQVASLGNYPYYMILAHVKTPDGNDVIPRFTINDDTSGSNGSSGKYSERHSYNGGADTTDKTFQTDSAVLCQTLDGAGKQAFIVNYLANLSGQEKLNICNSVDTDAGTGSNAPNRRNKVWKWANSSVVTSIELINGGSATANGDFGADDEFVVLGYDPTATNEENFWEELATVTSDGTSKTITSSTFAKKKYLWIQYYAHSATSGSQGSNGTIYVGTDSINTSNYAVRYSWENGDTDYTSGSTSGGLGQVESNYGAFGNMFVINNDGDEKLSIGSFTYADATGNTAPTATEYIGKWKTTSGQINIVQMHNSAGGSPPNFKNTTILKVWGHD